MAERSKVFLNFRGHESFISYSLNQVGLELNGLNQAGLELPKLSGVRIE
jgi:hypothetical protein